MTAMSERRRGLIRAFDVVPDADAPNNALERRRPRRHRRPTGICAPADGLAISLVVGCIGGIGVGAGRSSDVDGCARAPSRRGASPADACVYGEQTKGPIKVRPRGC